MAQPNPQPSGQRIDFTRANGETFTFYAQGKSAQELNKFIPILKEAFESGDDEYFNKTFNDVAKNIVIAPITDTDTLQPKKRSNPFSSKSKRPMPSGNKTSGVSTQDPVEACETLQDIDILIESYQRRLARLVDKRQTMDAELQKEALEKELRHELDNLDHTLGLMNEPNISTERKQELWNTCASIQESTTRLKDQLEKLS